MGPRVSLEPDLLTGFAALLHRRSGLSFAGANLTDLETGVIATGQTLGYATPRHLFQILNLDNEESTRAFEQLVRAVTIGETYFFRYPEQFTVLREDILPDLIQRKREQGDLTLRFWSAACSTGEEPYSLCLTLMRLLPDAANWRISILATDINRDSLARAEQAEYGAWSFRGVDPLVKQSFFEEIPGRRSPTFRFYPQVRKLLNKWVHFRYLNLKDHCYPSLLTQTTAMDFIFCRNVLIYFSQEVVRDVVRSFHTCLSYGGYLMVGPVEPNERTFKDYRSVFLKGTMLYQRAREEQARALVRPIVQRTPSPPRPQTLAPPTRIARGELAWREGRMNDARELFLKARGDDDRAAEPCFRLAVVAADRGAHDDALGLCLQAIERDSLDTRFYQLMSIVESERGNTEAAITALRKAVFLDRDFIMGHFGLAVNFLKVQEQKHAERHLRNCSSLLESANDDDILPGVEEIAAGWLKKVVNKNLRELTRNRDEQKNSDRRRHPHHS
jgi:chemotaxis protein methyltransferase CheR